MISYWEQESFTFYHHIVVGAGIVGLNAAIDLKLLFPAESVLVLERGLLPTGASTRNAGFACMGSVTELLDDLENTTEENMLRLFEQRKQGLELLRKRLGDERIGYRENGSYELVSEKEAGALDKIPYLNGLLAAITGKPAFRLANNKIGEFGFSKSYTKALIENTCEGELHTGNMMRALTDLAISYGVEIKTGAVVSAYSECEKQVTVTVCDAFRQSDHLLKCGQLCLCTNAFTRGLLPGADVTPGRGQVLITEPVAGLKFKGIYHFDKGYYYFREINGRVLLGGGRNLDPDAEATTEFAFNNDIQNDLRQKLAEMILPGQDFEIAQRWAGIMAFGASKFPIVKAFSPRVFGAFRMGGMGVALGSFTAREAVALMKENKALY